MLENCALSSVFSIYDLIKNDLNNFKFSWNTCQALSHLSKWICLSLNSEEAMVQPTRKELREEIKSKLEAAMICGQRICIDLSMENTMTSKVNSGDTLKL